MISTNAFPRQRYKDTAPSDVTCCFRDVKSMHVIVSVSEGCGARVHQRPDATLAVSLSPRTNQTYLHVSRACYLHGCESLSVLFRLTRRSAAAQTPVTSARRPEEICAAAARHAGMR